MKSWKGGKSLHIRGPDPGQGNHHCTNAIAVHLCFGIYISIIKDFLTMGRNIKIFKDNLKNVRPDYKLWRMLQILDSNKEKISIF